MMRVLLQGLGSGLLGGLIFAMYMLPTIIGKIRNVVNLGSVAVVNIFLGWSGIGWIVALAMAVRTQKKSPATD
jgi:hypothetical protein